MVKVAFLINFKINRWLGGFNLIVNLINSVNKLKNKKIEIVLIVNRSFKIKRLKNLNISIIKSDLFFNEGIFRKILNKFQIFFLGKSFIYEKFFISKNINILSHAQFPLGRKSKVKTFSWIPDFQYFHYPENFSFKDRILKKINIFMLEKNSYKIILSSKNAKNDLKKISQKACKKSVVNSFVYDLVDLKKIISFKKLKKKYGIKNNFFYLPNQYFIHKNHLVVLKALTRVIKQNRNTGMTIISTGLNNDHRHPNYFNSITKFIKLNGLKNNYKYLGIVPYLDMMSLIYHSIALINPSKFEGWSSSVEQAKSMGKKVILSNILVHKEQNPNRAKFFQVNNHIELSNILKKEFLKFNKSYEKKIIKNNYKKLEKRLINFAENYQKIILKKN